MSTIVPVPTFSLKNFFSPKYKEKVDSTMESRGGYGIVKNNMLLARLRLSFIALREQRFRNSLRIS